LAPDKNTITTPPIDPAAWDRKAKAFAVRSHRHLWGKNNEDPLAYLFTRGLKNSFIKECYLGWNKFGQERPCHTWGLGKTLKKAEKFLLPSGIVIPYIKDTLLIGIFIHPFCDATPTTIMVPGSGSCSMVFGNNKDSVCVITDIIDGLLLFQEKKETHSVLIHTDLSQPPVLEHLSLLDRAGEVKIYLKENQSGPDALTSLDRFGKRACITYKTQTDLIK